ncbi:MAG: phosphatidylserine decarboxylase, partial [Planctomycetota bacterium]
MLSTTLALRATVSSHAPMEAPHEPESEPRAIRYLNRATGEIEQERVFGGDALRWIYGTTLGRTLTDHLLSRPVLNRVYGFLKRRPETRSEVEAFVDRLGIDASEAARPLHAYTSLDDFFTRRLREGARPVDENPRHLLAPADSRVLVYPELSGQTLRVKGSSVTVAELMGDEAAAHLYEGGSALVFRLAPADYHRFHFP